MSKSKKNESKKNLYRLENGRISYLGQTISSYELGSFSEDEAKDFESATGGKLIKIKEEKKGKSEKTTAGDEGGDEKGDDSQKDDSNVNDAGGDEGDDLVTLDNQ